MAGRNSSRRPPVQSGVVSAAVSAGSRRKAPGDEPADAGGDGTPTAAAADAVFGARGAAGSTEEVARRAGVGIATVFRHFPTKEALIEAALVQHFARLGAKATELADEADAAAALRTLVATMIESGATKLTLASLVGEPGALPPAVHVAAEELRATMSTILERARAAGAVRADVTVDEIYLLVRGLAQATATQPASPKTLGRAIDIVQRGVAPDR